MAGYIKLHRQLLDSYQFSNPNNLKIWIWMLLKATHKPRITSIKVSKGYTDVNLERGQFVFGRNKAESELTIDASMIYRVIKYFEKDGSITVKSNNQYSIITICKYDDYNSKDENDEQPVNSQRTADEQPVNTDKKDKKGKNVKEVIMPPSIIEVKQYFSDHGFSEQSAQTAFDYYTRLNWHDSKNKKVINWKLKMNGVWFKDENKIVKQQQPKMVY